MPQPTPEEKNIIKRFPFPQPIHQRKGDKHQKMRELKSLVRLKWQEPCKEKVA